MKVKDTYIVLDSGKDTIRLYDCGDHGWYAERYNFIGDFIGLFAITEESARHMIDNTESNNESK